MAQSISIAQFQQIYETIKSAPVLSASEMNDVGVLYMQGVNITNDNLRPTEAINLIRSHIRQMSASSGTASSVGGIPISPNSAQFLNQLYSQYGQWTSTTDGEVEVEKPKEPPKPKEVNLTHLDKLIIKDEPKNEIISVLKQHKNSKLIFEEWGLSDTLKYGKGMTLLFHGGPGTGKTWAAHCIAECFGEELLIIGADAIQTSEPGGANRNIVEAFKTCKDTGKILFFDECDSLITNRNDVGMIISSEINTLLTEIEKYEGVCILATNRVDSLDEALERRISLIVNFPDPDYEARIAIWKKLVPDKMPLKDVKFDELAEFKLTGGQIKNCILMAARLAAAAEQKEVNEENFVTAIDRVQKSKSLMGKSSRWQQVRVKQDLVKTSNYEYSKL